MIMTTPALPQRLERGTNVRSPCCVCTRCPVNRMPYPRGIRPHVDFVGTANTTSGSARFRGDYSLNS